MIPHFFYTTFRSPFLPHFFYSVQERYTFFLDAFLTCVYGLRSNDIWRKNSVGEIPSNSRRAAARLPNRETETEKRREREILIALTREERLLGEARATTLKRESKRMLELERHLEASQQKRESQKDCNNIPKEVLCTTLISPKRCCASVERGVRGSVGNSGERVLREMLEAAKAREKALVMEVARIQV